MKKLILAVCLLAIAAANLSATPTVRGAYVVSSNSASVTLTWPTGTVSGDLVIMTAATANNILTLLASVGFTQNVALTGPQMSFYVWSKVMVPADITAGGMTLSVNSGGQANWGMTSVVTGTYTGLREFPAARSGTFSCCTGAATVTITSSSAVSATDLGIYFGALRKSGSFTVGISSGVAVGSTSVASLFFATLATDSAIVAGTQNVVFTLSAGSDGEAETAVYVIDAGSPPIPGSPPSARPIFW